MLTTVDEHQKLPPHEIGPKSGHLSTQFSKNCIVLTMVDEHQKLPSDETGPKSGHLSTQFSKELHCVDHG